MQKSKKKYKAILLVPPPANTLARFSLFKKKIKK